MRLGSCVAVAVVWGHGYSFDLTPSLRTSICFGCKPKKTKERKRERKKEKERKRERKREKERKEGRREHSGNEPMRTSILEDAGLIPGLVQ